MKLPTLRHLAFLLLPLLLTACDWFAPEETPPPPPAEPGIGEAVPWSALPGWQQDRLTEAWPAILAQCPRMIRKEPKIWQPLCAAAKTVDGRNERAIRDFLMLWFEPRIVVGSGGDTEGLFTGYYQPILHGSMTRSEKYRYPLYRRPDSLLKIKLDELFPELEGKRVRGRLEGNTVVPYFDRAAIDGDDKPLAGNELLWLDDPWGGFFLQIQGSGLVRLDDGSLVGVSYADQNGHPYVSIGRKLAEWGELPLEQVSMFAIRRWLDANPDKAQKLLNENPSYVFFTLRKNADENPRGSLNVPLTDLRSIAVDRRVIPLGSLVWMDTFYPDGRPLQRLMLAQDTGGAIKGHVRADIFFGTGDEAERLAGSMKHPGRLYLLVPKTLQPDSGQSPANGPAL